MEKRIIALIRAKNAARTIEQTLIQLARWVDKICVHLDPSTDDTKRICERYYCDIFEDKWKNPDDTFCEVIDWSILINMARKWKDKWKDFVYIVIIDADEVFEDAIIPFSQQLRTKLPIAKYIFKNLNFWKSTDKVRIDGLWDQQWRTRIFPLTDTLWFKELPIHAAYPEGLGDYEEFAMTSFGVKHYGFLTDRDAKDKLEMYRKVDKYGEIDGTDYSHLTEKDIELADYVPNKVLYKTETGERAS
jgi:glycosyltransferase involved in cell wall biosynthesis